MGGNSKKRASKLPALISVALIALLAVFIALSMSMRFPSAENADANVLPNHDIGVLLAAVVLIAIAAVLYFVFGRPAKPQFDEAEWRGAPDKEIHPAVFGRLCRWKRANSTDLAATLIRLAERGSIRVERGVRVDSRGREVSDYLLVREQAASSELHSIDDAALKLVFGVIGGGGSSVWIGDIHSFGRHRSGEFSSAMRTWQSTVSREVGRSGLYDRGSEVVHVVLLVVAAAAALAGLLATLGTQSAVPVACGVAAGAVSWLVSRQMPRHTQEGAEIYAKGKALRTWLRGGASVSGLGSFDPELLSFAHILREMGAACAAYPGLAEFCDELTVCIGSTAFAAESVVAYQSLQALNSPVRGATLDHSGVIGLGSPEEDSEELFKRRA